MAIIKHEFIFFMREASVKNVIYTSMIESVLKDEIILDLMMYMTTFITRSRGGALQSLEID
jgi:hypothetical protein